MTDGSSCTDDDAAPAFLRFADAALDCAQSDDAARELLAERLAVVRVELHTAHTADAFGALADSIGVGGAARECLALLLACELDPARSKRASAVGDSTSARLTLGTVASLLGGVQTCASAAGPGSRLSRSALIDIEGTGVWAARTLALAPSVVWAFAGDRTPEPDLPLGTSTLHLVPADGPSTSAGHSRERADLVVFVSGPDRVRRRHLALQRCRGDRFLVAPEPPGNAGWAALVRTATITDSTLLVELTGSVLPEEGRRWMERATHLRWAVTSSDDIPLAQLPDRERAEYTASAQPVSDAEWDEAFSGAVAHRHHLTAEQVELVVPAYLAVDGDLDLAVRRLLAGPLGAMTRRVRPRHGWDDLVLEPGKLQQLRTIVARYRHASMVLDEWGMDTSGGRGTVAMFSGQSGTGKTMAAGVIAGELQLDLYKVDLSVVVSKYIGETEQNLEKVFSAASAGNSVLFFDEADSLFGKRSEVKDARDRYANLEVSYLLQRLESYDGIVVLATNLPQNLDDAFLRRIHVVVDFPMPGAAQRRDIWQRYLTDAVPHEHIDFDRLAERFELTGGVIRNVVLAAAFRAADESLPVSMRHIMAALTAEYSKQRRMIRKEDFNDGVPAA